jgi:hypothetical protein
VGGNDTRRRESRYYDCMFCAGFHLTSEPSLAVS